jgi:ATP synthase F1 complex assembly factor 2
MANLLINKTLKSMRNLNLITALSSRSRQFGGGSTSTATAEQPQSDGDSSSFTFSSDGQELKNSTTTNQDDSIHIKPSASISKRETASPSVTMPMSFMTGSVVGKRFFNRVTTRKADDGNGWTVMLDYRTLKTPSKRPLKLPTLALAKAIAAEWEYQVCVSFCNGLFSTLRSLAQMGSSQNGKLLT